MSPVCRPCPRGRGQEHKPYGPWDKSKEQRYRKVRSASDHRKEGDDDVSCVRYSHLSEGTYRRCLLCAVHVPGAGDKSTSRMDPGTRAREQRYRKVRSASDHRKEGDDDVSCVPSAYRIARIAYRVAWRSHGWRSHGWRSHGWRSHGPWDKSKEQRYLRRGYRLRW